MVLLILALIAAMATRITAGLKLDVQTTATGVAGSSGAPGMAGSTSPADETGDQYDAGDEYDVGEEEHDEDGGEHEDREAAEYDRAQALYEQAMSLRFVSTDDTDNPLGGGSVMTTNQEDLKRSIHELYAAAGVVHLSMNTSSNPNATHHTADDVEVRWRHGKIQHIEAVRELVYAFRSGTGAPINPAIAHKLVRELAAAGVAEFQCDLAATYAMGIEPVAQNRDDIMFVLREPDLDQSMLQYLFSAKSGDPVAQMALGFRHLYGIGVEKSCHAAVLYYEPVAAGVIDSSATEGGLPVDGAVRLLDRRPTDGIKPVPTVEQEMLHYQWFADHGHAEAAKAVAHLLIHGDEQDLGAALDYLTQAADMGDGAAMAHIGHAYANGIAVAQSNSTARRWFIKAAEKGHPSGLFGLGVMYLKGQGVDVDNEKAVQYFTRAISIDKDWPGRSDAFFYAGTWLSSFRCWFAVVVAVHPSSRCSPIQSLTAPGVMQLLQKIKWTHRRCCARVVKGADLNASRFRIRGSSVPSADESRAGSNPVGSATFLPFLSH